MPDTRLFHVSEQHGIARFDPRPASGSHKIMGDVVWAVAEAGLYNYLTPRGCPRVSFFAQPATSEKDVAAFLDGDRDRKVLAIESAWCGRLLSTPLMRYEFAPTHFTLFDEAARYYLSEYAEVPIATQEVADPLAQLLADGIEVRLTPSLWELRERVLRSSLGFSFIRMKNAAPPPVGTVFRTL